MTSITFSTCFYIINSKFPPEKYIEWMQNFISIVNKFNLVIYTDENTVKHISTNNNPNIKIIIMPIENFYNCKYKDYWIKNHEKNVLLNQCSSWELNMLWSEKISFVKKTADMKYFNTDYYGWCDIGYFRNRPRDTNTSQLMNWPNIDKINMLDKNKIVYACVNNDDRHMNYLSMIVNNRNDNDLPVNPIPPSQVSIAGGFFILYKEKINWWFKMYDKTLYNYFKNNYLVKDDQIIIVDCILNNLEHFNIFREREFNYDNWFMFQRIFN
jgi:hypothetical protein